MDRALDRQCALVMGDVQIGHEWHSLSGSIYSDQDGGPLHYSGDSAAARLLEDEIERRGLQRQYVNWLFAYTALCSDPTDQCWAILRATPEPRARAFLQAVTP